jgi:hypothetical protein
MEFKIVNNAQEIPFSFIVQDLLSGNINRSPAKLAVFNKTQGVAAIDLPDIEAAITLIFQRGSLTIEPGIVHNPAIVVKTSYDMVMDLNMLNIRWGLPYYFDVAGRRVLGHLLSGRLKIKGMFANPVLLNNFTILMSVM